MNNLLEHSRTKANLMHRLRARDFLVGVGVHDAVGSRLVEQSGFDFLWASGLAVSTSHGVPDASILGMESFLEAARVINRATTLPVIADCDTGFGGINNAIYLAEQYSSAGIAGVCIEDKIFPKRNSFIDSTHDLEPIDIFCEKINKIKEHSRSRGMAVIARTETFISGGNSSEALERTRAYVAAGADAVLVHSKRKDEKQITEFFFFFYDHAPVFLAPTTYASVEMEKFQSMGVVGVICANQLLRASVKSMKEMLFTLRNGRSLSQVDPLISPLNDVLTMFSRDEWVDI